VIDPRTPELEAWIDGLHSAWQQVVFMRAICLAHPFVRVCPVWREKIAVLEDAMHLTPEEHQQIDFEAAEAAKGLKAA
jgi:hypothetical protein